MALSKHTDGPPVASAPLKARFPRPMLDFWNTPDKDLFSLTKKMITLAQEELKCAEAKGDSKRAGLLREACAFSCQKLQIVIDGHVSGTDIGAELRQALNVLLNSVYM